MLKKLVAQNWSKLERHERAQKNDPVDVNDTENRRCMRKLFSFEFANFSKKNGQFDFTKIFIKKRIFHGIF